MEKYYILHSDIDNTNFMVDEKGLNIRSNRKMSRDGYAYELQSHLTISFEGTKEQVVKRLFEIENRNTTYFIKAQYTDLTKQFNSKRIEEFEVIAHSEEDAKSLAQGRWYEEVEIISIQLRNKENDVKEALKSVCERLNTLISNDFEVVGNQFSDNGCLSKFAHEIEGKISDILSKLISNKNNYTTDMSILDLETQYSDLEYLMCSNSPDIRSQAVLKGIYKDLLYVINILKGSPRTISKDPYN